MNEKTYKAEEVTEILAREFAAPLIITASGFIVYGADCYPFVVYLLALPSKSDPRFVKVWVLLVMTMTTISSFYQVKFEWIFSITGFKVGYTRDPSVVNGIVVVLYSTVVMLVQFFWLLCIEATMNPRIKLKVLAPIAVGASCSFIAAVVVGILSSNSTADGFWPTPLISIFLRVVLGVDLEVDLAILIIIINRFSQMRKDLSHLNKTFSKLSWIFCISSIINTLAVVGELIINAPSSTTSFISITISLGALISPLYTFSMLSILNSRGELRSEDCDPSINSSNLNENQRPQMNFTNDAASAAGSGAAAAQSEPFREQPQSRNGLNE